MSGKKAEISEPPTLYCRYTCIIQLMRITYTLDVSTWSYVQLRTPSFVCEWNWAQENVYLNSPHWNHIRFLEIESLELLKNNRKRARKKICLIMRWRTRLATSNCFIARFDFLDFPAALTDSTFFGSHLTKFPVYILYNWTGQNVWRV